MLLRTAALLLLGCEMNVTEVGEEEEEEASNREHEQWEWIPYEKMVIENYCHDVAVIRRNKR